MGKLKETLLIMPAYNEEKSIGKVIKNVKRICPNLDILVIDDCSNDKTVNVAKNCGVKVTQHNENKGPAPTRQTGFKYSYKKGYKYTIQIDSDGQHSPKEIPKLLKEIYKDEADMVIGTRFFHKKDKKLCDNSWIRLLGNLFYSSLISKIIKQRLTDVASGFSAINQKTCKMFANDYPSPFFTVEPILMLWSNGCKIKEVPVEMSPRFFGKSFLTFKRAILYPIKAFIATLKYTLK